MVLKHGLEMFEEKFMIRFGDLTSNKRISKVAVGDTTDLAAYKIINILINKSVKNLCDAKPVEKKIIKPLYLFLDKEILLYAKIKGLRFKKSEEPKDKISKFVNELEKKHPEVKRAVVKGCLKLCN